MVITQVSICNSALIKLGAERINSLSEDNKRARLCNEQYPKLKEQLLSSHPWNFAVARAELVSTGNTPAFEYDYEYALPSDILRILKTNANLEGAIPESHWDIETNPTTNKKVLLTNESEMKIKYIRNVDESLFTPLFAEALALRLAYELSYALVQSVSLSSQMFQLFEKKVGEARSFDAQEGSLKQVEAYDWLNARF